MLAPRKARILSLPQSLEQRPQGAYKLRPSLTAGSRLLAFLVLGHLSLLVFNGRVCQGQKWKHLYPQELQKWKKNKQGRMFESYGGKSQMTAACGELMHQGQMDRDTLEPLGAPEVLSQLI